MRKPEGLNELTLVQLSTFVASTSSEQSFIAHLIQSKLHQKTYLLQLFRTFKSTSF